MLRVLAICYEDPAEILGGMGMHVRELYRAMARRDDVEIDLIVDGKYDGTINYCGYKKHHSDKLVCWKAAKPSLACLALMDLQMARTLTKLLAEGRRWDVVHCHEWTAVQISRMARDALQVPMVGTMHLCLSHLMQLENPDFDVTKLQESDLYMMQQEGHLVTDPDRFILCSKAYVEIVRHQFMTDRPISMIYNGIDLNEWKPKAGKSDRAKIRHGLSMTRPIALYVGRIATMKGIEPLLDAVEDQDSGYQIVLVGEVNANTKKDADGWYVTKRIKRLCADFPERLRWVGFQHGPYLKDLYAAADVALMPSIHEPFGIVALETMAMGVPLIATEVDGLGEIVVAEDRGGEEYALIIPSRSGRAINAALELLKDPEKRNELRELGLRRVRDFSWDEVASETVGVYQDAIANHRKLS